MGLFERVEMRGSSSAAGSVTAAAGCRPVGVVQDGVFNTPGSGGTSISHLTKFRCL